MCAFTLTHLTISIHPPRAGRDSNHAQNLLYAFLRNTQYNVQLNYYSHTSKRIFANYAFTFRLFACFSVRTYGFSPESFHFARSDHQDLLGLIAGLTPKCSIFVS